MIDLTPERALFRITHIDNAAWILDNGLFCRTSKTLDPNFREIGEPDLIEKRRNRLVPHPPGGTLSDYISFYFTPCSPMLYNLKTGFRGVKPVPMREILVLVSSLHRVAELGIEFVFSDRHAYLRTATFSNRLEDLHWLDWKCLREVDFRRSPDDSGKMDKMERYMAEALVSQHLPLNGLIGLACQEAAQKPVLDAEIARRGLRLQVIPKPEWYFG